MLEALAHRCLLRGRHPTVAARALAVFEGRAVLADEFDSKGAPVNYYRHHIGDYAEATAHLSILEDGVYSRLLRKYYATENPLPADVAVVQRLIGARSRAERAAVESVLREFFICMEDGWHQSRCDEDIAAEGKRSEIARLSAKQRWSRREDDDNANAMPTQCEGNANAMRAAGETHADGNAPHSPFPIPHSKNAADAATPPDPGDPKKALFDLGVSLLGEGKRGLIGKAVSRAGLPKVGEVLAYLASNTVADPASYFAKATTPREDRSDRFATA